MRDYYSEDSVSYDDVVKLLFELKKDKHAARVLRMGEEIKRLQGNLEASYKTNPSPNYCIDCAATPNPYCERHDAP